MQRSDTVQFSNEDAEARKNNLWGHRKIMANLEQNRVQLSIPSQWTILFYVSQTGKSNWLFYVHYDWCHQERVLWSNVHTTSLSRHQRWWPGDLHFPLQNYEFSICTVPWTLVNLLNLSESLCNLSKPRRTQSSWSCSHTGLSFLQSDISARRMAQVLVSNKDRVGILVLSHCCVPYQSLPSLASLLEHEMGPLMRMEGKYTARALNSGWHCKRSLTAGTSKFSAEC